MHKWNPLEDISDQTVRLLETFANQAGITIQNAYLHEKTKEAYGFCMKKALAIFITYTKNYRT